MMPFMCQATWPVFLYLHGLCTELISIYWSRPNISSLHDGYNTETPCLIPWCPLNCMGSRSAQTCPRKSLRAPGVCVEQTEGYIFSWAQLLKLLLWLLSSLCVDCPVSLWTGQGNLCLHPHLRYVTSFKIFGKERVWVKYV